MHKAILAGLMAASIFSISSCNNRENEQQETSEASQKATSHAETNTKKLNWLDKAAEDRANIYVSVELKADLTHLSDNQKSMLKLLIKASRVMDKLFWAQAYGSQAELLGKLETSTQKHFTNLNYGPWDRLNGDKPLFSGIKEKSPGAQFYPADMTKKEFEQADLPGKKGLYSLVKRNAEGKLVLQPFHEAYKAELTQAAELLKQASKLADNQEFAQYLTMRASALITDDFQASDLAWMDMKSNPIELVIGPIETYEDQLFGYRAAYESYVLLKDMAWSKKLAKYASFLPELQKGLPVSAAYKPKMSGTGSDLNAYDVIFYAGHSNAGSKTIAINLPNDEEVQLKKGTRRLQLKNAMRAKFDKILLPISETLIAADQRKHVQFHAFFANTMFHEVAHGLGIKNTLSGSGTVRQALKEHASAFEEGKADILGLYMVTELFKKGEIEEGELMDYYTTFLAGIFRSVRFGASSAHGKANMMRFNYFADKEAFERNEKDGSYRVNFDKFQQAMADLSKDILTIQGDGDYEKAHQWISTKGIIDENLQTDLNRLETAGIPVDVAFVQGETVLGL